MTNQHSVTMLSDLVEQLESDIDCCAISTSEALARAYAAGADQELEECVSYVDNNFSGNKARALRALRRPKTPSLKEQALAVLDDASDRLDAAHEYTIRRALEQLND